MRIFKFIASLYLTHRFFGLLICVGLLFLFSYWLQPIYPIAWLGFFSIFFLWFIDIIVLYRGGCQIEGKRILPEKFSNGDQNELNISIKNNYPFTTNIEIIDEIPFQFQKRDFSKKIIIPAKSSNDFTYQLKPLQRGEYFFGKLNIYTASPLQLAKRKDTFLNNQMVKVYPSFIQMKKYAFLAQDKRLTHYGMKKVRRIGNTLEFEQIKDYIPGDDIRTINWKATAKRAQLMVNQYQDEKSQPIYCLIDASRVMKMPFEGLSLLDYAINSTLAFSNIALKKSDKVGLITFSEKIINHVPSNSKKTHLSTLLETLYNTKTQFLDADYGRLYNRIKHKITHRSLLILYSNFEHITSLQRQMPYLKALSRKHILVVVLFENTQLDDLLHTNSNKLQNIYHKAIAQKSDYDKKTMVKLLHQYGIQTILTRPEALTIQTINKYLEIKARGIL